MKLGDTLVDGIFLRRPNRYLAHVTVDGVETTAHVPDPGRLPGLMIAGRSVRLIHNPGPTRKTDYTLALVRHGSIWVSVYPVFANKVVEEALAAGKIDVFGSVQSHASEVKVGKSRFDFELTTAGGRILVEVKSVSFVEDTVGKFPDAPTERGVKHLKELIQLKQEGVRTAVLLVSPRSDTRSIAPNDAIDPKFGTWLRNAHAAGVELYGYNCRVTPSSVSLDRRVEIVFPDQRDSVG